MALKHHPDTSKDPKAHAHMKSINAAHGILSDAAKREEYDQQLYQEESVRPPTSSSHSTQSSSSNNESSRTAENAHKEPHIGNPETKFHHTRRKPFSAVYPFITIILISILGMMYAGLPRTSFSDRKEVARPLPTGLKDKVGQKQREAPQQEPGKQSSEPIPQHMPKNFEFNDTSNAVTVRGTQWLYLFSADGVSNVGPGAKVECIANRGTCNITQFDDGGAASNLSTYKITRWDSERIEAENSSATMPNDQLSDSSPSTCLILNREKQQLFMAPKQNGQSCRQVNEYLEYYYFIADNREKPTVGRFLMGAQQLCAKKKMNAGGDPIYECPNPPPL